MTAGRSTKDKKMVDPRNNDQQIVSVFKALSHPFRLELLRLLACEEFCVCHLVERTGRPQPYVSQQVGVLRRAGLVSTWRERRESASRFITGSIETACAGFWA